jgi:hypothetical protein
VGGRRLAGSQTNKYDTARINMGTNGKNACACSDSTKEGIEQVSAPGDLLDSSHVRNGCRLLGSAAKERYRAASQRVSGGIMTL